MVETFCPYVSRGGLKLAAALAAMPLHVNGLTAADLGCSTGGFTDCLLQHGAAHVYSVDTAYGQFDWKLRNDPRVTLLERTNALHLNPHEPGVKAGAAKKLTGFAGVDLVVIDLGWTRQRLAIPAALRWLRQTGSHDRSSENNTLVMQTPCIITLIKPQYEAAAELVRGRHGGILDDAHLPGVIEKVLGEMPQWGVRVGGCIASPIRGSAAGGKPGNQEYLTWLYPG